MRRLQVNNDFLTKSKTLAGRKLLVSLLLLLPAASFAQLNKQKPQNLQDVGIEERLGEKIPLDIKFATTEGDSVTLADLMEGDKPVLLTPVYFKCPQLCPLVIDAVVQGVKPLEWDPGTDYTIITFSFDSTERHRLAADKKDSILKLIDRPKASEGWYFLTGKQKAIDKLTDAIGFKYNPIERKGEFAHTASIMFLSPEGTITRYLYGIKFDQFDIKNALYEAADGKIGSTVDKVILYCYQYDPDSGSYVPVAWRIMQLGGLLTVVVLGAFLGFMWLKHRTSGSKTQL